MKIGVIVESFREGLFQAMESAAAAGVQGVQMYAVCKDHDLTAMSESELAALKNHIDKLGLKVASICGDLGGHGFQDEAGNAKRVELSKKIIDLCVFTFLYFSSSKLSRNVSNFANTYKSFFIASRSSTLILESKRGR